MNLAWPSPTTPPGSFLDILHAELKKQRKWHPELQQPDAQKTRDALSLFKKAKLCPIIHGKLVLLSPNVDWKGTFLGATWEPSGLLLFALPFFVIMQKPWNHLQNEETTPRC